MKTVTITNPRLEKSGHRRVEVKDRLVIFGVPTELTEAQANHLEQEAERLKEQGFSVVYGGATDSKEKGDTGEETGPGDPSPNPRGTARSRSR